MHFNFLKNALQLGSFPVISQDVRLLLKSAEAIVSLPTMAKEQSILLASALFSNDSIKLCYEDHKNGDTQRWASYAFIINGFILLIVIIIGALGNALCLVAFRRRSGTRICARINYYLIALSSWDLCLVLSSFCLYTLPHLIYGRLLMHGRIVVTYPLVYALACSAHMASVWTVIAMAMDRYFALCHPLTHKVYSSRRVTVLVLCACGLLSVAFNAPKYLEISVSRCQRSDDHDITFAAAPSGLRSDAVYWTAYKVVGGLLLFSLGPFLTLSFLSLRVWCEVRKLTSVLLVNTATPLKTAGQRERESLCTKNSDSPSVLSLRYFHKYGSNIGESSLNRSPIRAAVAALRRQSPECVQVKDSIRALRRHSSCQETAKESQTAVNSILFCVLLKFLLCHSLPTVLDLCESFMTRETFQSIWISHLVDTSNLLVVTNSSLNFVIYLTCSRRFRSQVVDLLPKAIAKKNRRLRKQLTRCRRCTISTCAFHRQTTCPHFNHYFLQQTQDQFDFSVSVAKQSALILSSAGLTFVDKKLLAAYTQAQ